MRLPEHLLEQINEQNQDDSRFKFKGKRPENRKQKRKAKRLEKKAKRNKVSVEQVKVKQNKQETHISKPLIEKVASENSNANFFKLVNQQTDPGFDEDEANIKKYAKKLGIKQVGSIPQSFDEDGLGCLHIFSNSSFI